MVLICGLLCAGAYFLAKQSKTNNKANDAEEPKLGKLSASRCARFCLTGSMVQNAKPL